MYERRAPENPYSRPPRAGPTTAANCQSDDLQVTVATRRSDFEDADYSKLLVDLTAHETVYQASLAVTSRLSKLTLASST